jgi:putative FmdB family regulatory protein
MPIYEYQCGQCGQAVEMLQHVSEAPLISCPKCGQDALTKLISSSSFQLKGTGWYKTDYAAKPPASDSNNVADTPTKEAVESKTENKVETKKDNSSDSKAV